MAKSKGKGPHDAGQACKVYNHMTNGKPSEAKKGSKRGGKHG